MEGYTKKPVCPTASAMASFFTVSHTLDAADPMNLFNIGVAAWASPILRVFCSLEIPERLANGPKSSGKLAEESGANAALMFRFLRAASMTGVCAQTEGTTFELTPLGQFCRADHPKTLRGFFMLSMSLEHIKCWGHLEHVVRTGEPALKPALGIENFYDLFKLNPAHIKLFEDGMKGFMETPIAPACGFKGMKKFVDIGAGPGDLTKELLRKYPYMQGVMSDLPEVVDYMDVPNDIRDRCTTQAWNFLTGDPKAISGADGYFLKHILHNWDDKSCVTLLSKIAEAMPPSGKVYVVESGPVPQDNTPHFSKFLDIGMAVMTGAKERTKEEHSILFEQAGLRLKGVEILEGPLCMLIAVKSQS